MPVGRFPRDRIRAENKRVVFYKKWHFEKDTVVGFDQYERRKKGFLKIKQRSGRVRVVKEGALRDIFPEPMQLLFRIRKATQERLKTMLPGCVIEIKE